MACFNLVHLCNSCHRWFHSKGYEGRRIAFQMNCKRYGKDNMMEWYEGLDLITKERMW